MTTAGKRLFSVLIVLLMVMSGLIPGAGISVFADDSIPAADWMSKLPDNAYLNSLNIPGTHDSGMFKSSSPTSAFALTQDIDIGSQLEAGARIFDIRLRYGGSNRCVLCHGQGEILRYDAECPYSDSLSRPFKNSKGHYLYTYDMVLLQIADFLEKHSDETVILTVKHEHEAADAKESTDENGNVQNMDTALAAAEQELSDILSERGNKIIRCDYSQRYNVSLTMNEARGNVIIFEYGMSFGDLMPKTLNKYSYTFADKWTILLPYFDSAPNQNITDKKTRGEFRAAYTSSTGQLTYDRNGNLIRNNVGFYYGKSDNETVNDSLVLVLPTPAKEGRSMKKLLLNYTFEKGAYYGWISMDFLDEPLARKIFESNDFEGSGDRETKPATYISEIKGFSDCVYDDAVEECLNQGYTILNGTRSSDETLFRDVNPKGRPIVIGYKTTTDPNNAITDIIGSYNNLVPHNYVKVRINNSLYNYFTLGSGIKSRYTYLFYSKSASKTPITLIELKDIADGKEIVKVKNSDKDFNIQKGFDFFYGLNIGR